MYNIYKITFMNLRSHKKEVLLKIAYLGFFLAGAIFTLGYPPFSFSFYQLGQILGTLALTALTLQLLMGARIKLLEKGVGLDRILRWHSLNARLALIFILLHPVLMFGPLVYSGTDILKLIASFNLFYWLGIAALLLIILTILSTVYQSRIKLNYEHWKIVHKSGYLIIIFGFIHSFFVGSDILARNPLYYWWIILAVVAGFALVYRYLLRRWFLKDNLYEITRIVKESPDVASIYFKPTKGKIFPYFPGQFAFVRLYSKNLSDEEHHFTISSSPLDNLISFTVKESGDFTSRLDKLKIGDKAKIEGPFGVFSNADMSGPFVFIAGGIGITPLMSMLRFMRDTNCKDKTTVFYAAGTKKDLIFIKELEKMKKKSVSRLVYVLSDEVIKGKNNGFYHGRVTPKILQRYVKNFKSQKFFLVGPPPMMDIVEKILKSLGAKSGYIFTEKFALK